MAVCLFFRIGSAAAGCGRVPCAAVCACVCDGPCVLSPAVPAAAMRRRCCAAAAPLPLCCATLLRHGCCALWLQPSPPPPSPAAGPHVVSQAVWAARRSGVGVDSACSQRSYRRLLLRARPSYRRRHLHRPLHWQSCWRRTVRSSRLDAGSARGTGAATSSSCARWWPRTAALAPAPGPAATTCGCGACANTVEQVWSASRRQMAQPCAFVSGLSCWGGARSCSRTMSSLPPPSVASPLGCCGAWRAWRCLRRTWRRWATMTSPR
jgi:hypothetical protein